MTATDELTDRRTAEVVHKYYFGLMTETQAVAALRACGVGDVHPDRLHAAVEVYTDFTRALDRIMGTDPAADPEVSP